MENKASSKKFWLWIIILGTLIFGAIYLYNNNDGFKNATNAVADKKLSVNEVTIDVEQSLTAISITVKPSVDVKDIKIEYELINSKDAVTRTGCLEKNDLEKNRTYSYDLELSFTELLNTRSVRYRMISGTKA